MTWLVCVDFVQRAPYFFNSLKIRNRICEDCKHIISTSKLPVSRKQQEGTAARADLLCGFLRSLKMTCKFVDQFDRVEYFMLCMERYWVTNPLFIILRWSRCLKQFHTSILCFSVALSYHPAHFDTIIYSIFNHLIFIARPHSFMNATRDIDTATLCVCLSVRHTLVLCQNG